MKQEEAELAKGEAELGEPCAAAELEPKVAAYANECSAQNAAQQRHLEELKELAG